VASYPGSVRSFTTKQNVVDLIDASHPNVLQDEVAAIQTIVGINPHVSTAPSPAGTFITVSTTFASLAARIANIETGVVADSHTQYLHLSGGDTMQGSTDSTIVHRIRARAGQTGALVRVESNDQATAYFQVTTGGVAASALTVAGSPVLTQANAPSNLSLSSSLPTTYDVARKVGTGTAAAHEDHAHGPAPYRAISMMLMGA